MSAAAVAAVLALGELAGPTPATLMTQDSVNVFRRFSVEREKVLSFYSDAVGLQTAPTLNMTGGGQMSQFHIGTSLFKFNTAGGRQEKSGPVLDVTGLRVFTFFYADEAAVTKAFASHGYPAPQFDGPASHRRALATDPDGQWVELVVDPKSDASHFEVGATVSDVERSRAFYREFEIG